jgi:undecaprenyl-diphosphatase
MNIFIIILLSIVQGMAELLPVSSSAHVILVEKFLGLNPSSPELTFLLVMLHTGTMFAVLVYFWPRWIKLLSRENPFRLDFIKIIIYGTAATGIIGLGLQYAIEKFISPGKPVEDIFGNTVIIGIALGAAGLMIIVSGLLPGKNKNPGNVKENYSVKNSIVIGSIQGLALPFRGFSRSGSTISAALLLGEPRAFSEEYSFILALILTPAVIIREFLRLRHIASPGLSLPFLPGLLGMVFSFLAGLAAIKWLSSWLERGRWPVFGFYCLLLASCILVLTGLNILR